MGPIEAFFLQVLLYMGLALAPVGSRMHIVVVDESIPDRLFKHSSYQSNSMYLRLYADGQLIDVLGRQCDYARLSKVVHEHSAAESFHLHLMVCEQPRPRLSTLVTVLRRVGSSVSPKYEHYVYVHIQTQRLPTEQE